MEPEQPVGGLAYEEVGLPEYAEQASRSFELAGTGAGMVILRGRCPRCGLAMRFPVAERIYRGDAPGNGTAPTVVFCTAEDPFPGRPAGRTGCGAYWSLLIPQQP